MNTGARLTGPGVVPINANMTNPQYGVTSAYSSSYKSGGYASGYNPNVNSKTPVHFNSGSNYYAPVGNVEKKVVIPNSGPAYSVKEEYQEIKSPGRVTY